MTQSQMILYVIKLVLGGTGAFCAILLWSKTKDSAWMCLVAGAVCRYAGLVYEMFITLGIVMPELVNVVGIPVSTLVFTILPDIFFILAFILMLVRTNHK